MERDKVIKGVFRREDIRRRGKGLYSTTGNLCTTEEFGGEEGSVSRHVSREDGMEGDREHQGEVDGGLEGPEQEARGDDSIHDGANEEELEWDVREDITGIINLIETRDPGFDEEIKRTREIRRSTKERKRLADELESLFLALM